MRTHWEHLKASTPIVPKTTKNLALRVHAASPHWLQECFWLTYALCHFWPRLMARAQTMDHHQFLLKNLNFFNILGFMCPLWGLNWILRSSLVDDFCPQYSFAESKHIKEGADHGTERALLEQGSLNPKPMRSHQCKICLGRLF